MSTPSKDRESQKSSNFHPTVADAMDNIGDSAKKNYFSLFPEELIVSMLDAFIINKPMSGSVGGDGFWVHQTKDSLIVVVFDCMGHGHLASMMTRIYTRALEKVIVQDKVEVPGEILVQIHEEVRAKFEGKDNLQVGSGADVGIVKIGMAERFMEFAGAKMDLFQVKGGEMELIKADRIQIGDLFEYEHKYNTLRLDLEKGGVNNFYLSSDGFKDLLGGEGGKKLSKNGVKSLLEGQFGKPMIEQKKEIQAYLDEWSKYYSPLDDLLIVGFSI
jgi:two-component system, sensor histidine kinase SagS